MGIALFEYHIHNAIDLSDIEKEIKRLNTKLQNIMATLAQLNEKVDALQTALDSEQEQIRTAIQTLQTTVDELRQNQTEGGTAEERQALADKLDAVITDLQGTIADTPTEPTPEA